MRATLCTITNKSVNMKLSAGLSTNQNNSQIEVWSKLGRDCSPMSIATGWAIMATAAMSNKLKFKRCNKYINSYVLISAWTNNTAKQCKCVNSQNKTYLTKNQSYCYQKQRS